MTRGADALVDMLRIEGVKFVSTLPGDDILPIFDALHQNHQGHEIGISLRGDYAGVAPALGAFVERIQKPEEIRPALGHALAHPEPVLLEIAVKPLEPRPWR